MSERTPPHEDPDPPDWLLGAGALFGLSRIQTRWKLIAIVRKWRAFKADLAPSTSQRVPRDQCAGCGAVLPIEGGACTKCGAKVSGLARTLHAAGLSIPAFVPTSALLGLAIIAAHVRMMIGWPGEGLWTWKREALIAHGGLWGPAIFEGQWWRLGTYMFIHLGVLHLFFNIAALSQIGPSIESVFGRARMVLFFALTGVLAGLASILVMPLTPSAGASGAIMGLIGVAAAWGHRQGTASGREVRNQMLKWAAYTMLFGLMFRANHVAHAAGFASGALLGAMFQPRMLGKTKQTTLTLAGGILGGVACLGFFVLTIAPPTASYETAAKFRPRPRVLVMQER